LNDLFDFFDDKGINKAPIPEHRVPMSFVSTTKPATKTPAAKGGTTR
jgi:hypothetical protein